MTDTDDRLCGARRYDGKYDEASVHGGIQYIATGEGWLYLAAVLDLATRKIVGWAMRDHMRTELPLAAMMMAAQRQRPDRGLICHSDRGSQYAAGACVDHLAAIGATPSMSAPAIVTGVTAEQVITH